MILIYSELHVPFGKHKWEKCKRNTWNIIIIIIVENGHGDKSEKGILLRHFLSRRRRRIGERLRHNGWRWSIRIINRTKFKYYFNTTKAAKIKSHVGSKVSRFFFKFKFPPFLPPLSLLLPYTRVIIISNLIPLKNGSSNLPNSRNFHIVL